MQVYASTACIDGGRSLWQILDAYESVGLEAVELGSARVDRGGGLAGRLRQRPFAYVLHNYFPPPAEPFVLNLASPDLDVGARSAAFVAASLELASALEAPFYAVHGGFAVDPVPTAGGLSFAGSPAGTKRSEAVRRYETRIGPLATRAAELGVALLVENNVCTPQNRGKLLHQTAEELEELVATVAGVGLLVDTGHLNVTATTFGFDREEFVHTLAPRIAAFHVHDNDGHVDRHSPVAAASWILPLLALVDVPVVVEARFEDASALAEHVRWLGQR